MTSLPIKSNAGPRMVLVENYIAAGIPRDQAYIDQSTITCQDIHEYIIRQESAMDEDVKMVHELLVQETAKHGFNVNIVHEIDQLELHNAWWYITQGDEVNHTFIMGPRDYHWPASTTPRMLEAWLHVVDNPFTKLQHHIRAVQEHNADMKKVSDRCSELATLGQWCSDYETVMERIQEGFDVTKCPDFGHRIRVHEYVVCVTVAVNVMATSRDDAIEKWSIEMATSMLNVGNYEVTDVEAV
jgi:hypothetical protein